MWNRNSAMAFKVHFSSLKKPLRPSPLTGYMCMGVHTTDCSEIPLLDWCNGRIRIFLGNNTFSFVLIWIWDTWGLWKRNSPLPEILYINLRLLQAIMNLWTFFINLQRCIHIYTYIHVYLYQPMGYNYHCSIPATYEYNGCVFLQKEIGIK